MALRAFQRTIGRRYYLLPTNNTRAAGRLFQARRRRCSMRRAQFQKFQVVPIALGRSR